MFMTGFQKIAHSIDDSDNQSAGAGFGRGFEKVAVSKNWKALRMAHGELQRRLGMGVREYQQSRIGYNKAAKFGDKLRHYQTYVKRRGRMGSAQRKLDLQKSNLSNKATAVDENFRKKFVGHKPPELAPQSAPAHEPVTAPSEHLTQAPSLSETTPAAVNPRPEPIAPAHSEVAAPKTRKRGSRKKEEKRGFGRGFAIAGGALAAGAGTAYALAKYRRKRTEQPAQLDNNDRPTNSYDRLVRSAS